MLPGLDRRRRVELVLEVARAVAHAHARGVVHRDLKPQNVLVDEDGRPRVADFGLATALGLERLTRTGELMGTPTHMSPEQLGGERATEPTVDVWALGVILYRALTDRLPFEGGSVVQLAYRVLEKGPPTPPRALDPSISSALERVVLRALERDPRARQRDASVFVDELQAAGHGAPPRTAHLRRVVLIGALALPAVGVAAALSWRADQQASARLASVSASIRAHLASGEPLARADAALPGLRAELDEVRSGGRCAPADVEAAARALAAFEGLVALAAGDVERASERRLAAGDAGPAPLLAAGLAAITSHGGGQPAFAALDATGRAGSRPPEVRLWRAIAAASAGLSRPDAARELEVLEEANRPLPAVAPAVSVARARALLVMNRPREALASLGSVPPPDDIRWALALLDLQLALRSRDLAAAAAALAPVEAVTRPATVKEPVASSEELLQLLQDRGRGLGGGAEHAQARRAVLAGLRALRTLVQDRPLPADVATALLSAAGANSSFGSLDEPVLVNLWKLAPDLPEVQVQLAMTGQQNCSPELERVCLEAARRAFRSADGARRATVGPTLCHLLDKLGEHDECIATAAEVLPHVADDGALVAVLRARGQSLRRRGRNEAAIADLSRAEAMAPLVGDIPEALALALNGAGRSGEAVERAAQLLPRFVEGDRTTDHAKIAGIVWDHARDAPEHRPALARAAERIARSFPSWWLRLALMQLEAGDDTGALQSLRSALTTQGIDPGADVRADAGLLIGAVSNDATSGLARLREVVRRLDEARGLNGAFP